MNKLFIGIAGNIGSGKTTLTTRVSEFINGAAHYESVNENPYLSDFYADMRRWSFALQVHFLNHRFKSHRYINSNFGRHVQDRTIYEDANIFAPALRENGQMDERDYENYLSLFDSMTGLLKKPDLIVYLKTDVSKLLDRIKLRNRNFEKGISPAYLELLNEKYDRWIESYTGAKLIIDNNPLDFVKSNSDLTAVLEIVTNHPEVRSANEVSEIHL